MTRPASRIYYESSVITVERSAPALGVSTTTYSERCRHRRRLPCLGSWLARPDLTARLIDEMHLVIAPALLGRGENLLAGIDTVNLGYKCTQHASSDHATHVVLTR